MASKGIIGNIKRKYKFYQAVNKYCRNPPGHFYSPIVNTDLIREKESYLWKDNYNLSGIDLNLEEQFELLKEIERFYPNLHFSEDPHKDDRYYFNNSYFSYADAIVLYGLLAHLQPKNVIEIGSGFSSALMLDYNEKNKNKIEYSFIEPYPKRLYSLFNSSDKSTYNVIEKGVQQVDVSLFSKLKKNDILFIDSTHVSKTGSDVNYILFDIIPSLEQGVYIHFHDVFNGFEYPKEWVYQNRNWNEDYILRAFLMYNDRFRIKCFANLLQVEYPDRFTKMPLFNKSRASSLWIEKN